MTTHVTTHNPVRTDVPAPQELAVAPTARPGRLWAVAGLLGGLSAVGAFVSAGMVGSVYNNDFKGDTGKIADDLADFGPQMIAFHAFATVAALLIAVFGLGLYRRLRAAMPGDSLAPAAAAFGFLGTAVVLVLGSGLDTEFAFAVTQDDIVSDEALVIYNHWIGTIPGCWVLTGITGLALFQAARAGAVARWIGITGLVLGGLSLLTSIAPLQYMSAATGALMLLLVAAGFTFGDKAHRA